MRTNLGLIEQLASSIQSIATWQRKIDMLDSEILNKYELNIDIKSYIYMIDQIVDYISNNHPIEEFSSKIQKLFLSVNEITARTNEATYSQRQLDCLKFQQSIEDAEEYFYSLSPIEFENFTAGLFQKLGYSCRLTPTSGDYGIDIIAEKEEKRLGIQVKHYTKEVGIKAIQEVSSGMQYYDCDYGCVVTCAPDFTKAAHKLADKLDIKLIAFYELMDLYNMNR